MLERFFADPAAFDGCEMAHAVERSAIGENGDWGLSGDRYFVEAVNPAGSYERLPISALVKRVSDTVDPSTINGSVNYIGLENIESETGRLVGDVFTLGSDIKSLKAVFAKGDVLYGKLRPNLNKVFGASFDGICSTAFR